MSRNILLSLGVLALLAGGLLAFIWFRPPETAPASAPVATQVTTTSILVAARAIPAGTLIRAKDVTWAEVPAAAVPHAAILGGGPADAVLAAYVGAVTRQAFAKGAAVASDAMVKSGDANFLGVALRPGFRAISISVDAAQSTTGLVVPGDKVDIILTQSFQGQGTDPGHRSVGETVLHDLRVIAVDQTLTPAAKPASPPTVGSTTVPKTITLEVTEHQAEMLLVAEQLGKIQLSLLGEADQEAATAAVSVAVAPAWAFDVSPALASRTQVPPHEGSDRPISVMHGAKTERVCVTSAGLAPCS
jgi:pilus assembly protein CpaB